MSSNPSPKRGEVWIADLGEPTGSEQAGARRTVIIQSDLVVGGRTTVVIPATTKTKARKAGQTVSVAAGTNGFTADAIILCRQLRVLDLSKFQAKTGKLDEAVMAKVEAAVLYILALPS